MGRLGCPCGNVLVLTGSGEHDFTFFSDTEEDALLPFVPAADADPVVAVLEQLGGARLHECRECGRLLIFPKGRAKALVYTREGHAELVGGE